MVKKKKTNQKLPNQASKETETAEGLTLKDQLGGDTLAKLKAAKQSLVAQAQVEEEERQAQLVFERKQKEKNMSFEELLEKYGEQGSKF